MARAKPTKKTIENMMSTVLKEAKAKKKSRKLLAAIVGKMGDADREVVDTALNTVIEAMAASLPAHKRRKFLEELLAFVQSN